MSNFETAKKFFEACEKPSGWAGCKDFVADGATFSGQCEPLVDIKTLEAYTDWMHGFGTITTPGAHYVLNSSAFDESTNTAMFFATYHGTHSGEGGPVPPTGKATQSDYVYMIRMNDAGKVASMHKVWNAPWAMRELGWPAPA